MCKREDAAECSYTDRRGKRCGLSWCPDHQKSILGMCYCIRHGNTVSALELWEGGGESRRLDTAKLAKLPDVKNRAPSLVYWVALAIDSQVREIMAAACGVRSDQVERSAVKSFIGRGQMDHWITTWNPDGPGRNAAVSVEIGEMRPTEVVINVNGQPVTKGVPPWVTHHENLERVDAETDDRERKDYFAGIVEAISNALGA
jgi:hypothetical protein